MATTAEILAAADRAEKAGDAAGAAKLRAYAQTPSAQSVMSAASKAMAAGDKEAADKLSAYAQTMPDYRGARMSYLGSQPDVMVPPAADLPSQMTPPAPQHFGDTAAYLAQQPWDAAKAFGGGLVGGPSPSRSFLANDPMTRDWNPQVLNTLGAVGDLGGMALSAGGAAINGMIGYGVDAVPGMTRTGRQNLGEDLSAMPQFAVPELAGGSSVAMMAGRMPKPVPEATSRLAGDIAAADKVGIPVMRTDVKPPQTFAGKVIQKTGEAIPIAGTGPVRAKQNAARVAAVQDVIRQFGADIPASAIPDVTASLIAKRGADLAKWVGRKTSVINGIKGVVEAPRAIAAIDAQIAKLAEQGMSSLQPVINKLEEFKAAVTGKTLPVIEENRKVIGDAFVDMGDLRTVGEKALSAVYGPLNEDMGAFIKGSAGGAAYRIWKAANTAIAGSIKEEKLTALGAVLKKGAETPEAVRTMLFSKKPSDIALLYRNLTPEGKAAARTAVIQEAFSKAGEFNTVSPEKFRAEIARLGTQVGVMFSGSDLEAVQGLMKALKLTQHASAAGVATSTGMMNFPAVISGLVGSMTGSVVGTFGGLGTIGGLARVYEATGVRSALRAVARAEGAAQASAISRLATAIREATPAMGVAANEANNPNRAAK